MPTETHTVNFWGAYDGTRKREGAYAPIWVVSQECAALVPCRGQGAVFFIAALQIKAVGSGPSISAQNINKGRQAE